MPPHVYHPVNIVRGIGDGDEHHGYAPLVVYRPVFHLVTLTLYYVLRQRARESKIKRGDSNISLPERERERERDKEREIERERERKKERICLTSFPIY